MKNDNINKILESINIKNISSTINFWMVRSKKGFFFDEFVNEKFIALGWNNITYKEVENIISQKDKKSEKAVRDRLKKDIEKKYPRNKRPSQSLNKCIRFICEIKKGDIIMIPSSENQQIAFAIVGDYYEDPTCTYKEEVEVIDRIDSHVDYGINEKCPYRKRRKISILKIIDGDKLNINLYKVLASYHGLSDINKYSDFILSSIYNLYYWNDKINMVFNVEKKGEIDAFDLSSFMYNSSNMFKILNDNIKVSTKANLNSPGDLILSVQHYGSTAIELLKSHKFILAMATIWFSVTGGKIGPIEFKSAAELLMKWKEHNIKIRSDKLDLIKKEKEISELDMKKLLISQKEIEKSSENLEINKQNASNIIDFSKYHHYENENN